ncbi:MAG: Rne/Rng family ribonuclease, partial [Thermoanaerobaculia bacterium]
RSLVGSIYRGRVARVVPGLEAAFVDIGLDRDAYLPVGDLRPRTRSPDPRGSAADGSIEAPEAKLEPIDRLLKAGDLLTVQVAKDSLPSKGVSVTTDVGLPGRFLVFLPKSDGVRISRRIENEPERERLSDLLENLVTAPGGVIVRTAGEGRSGADFKADLDRLIERWATIQEKESLADSPEFLYRDEGLALRWVRDVLSDATDEFLVDSEAAYGEVVSCVRELEPSLVDRVHLWNKSESLFGEHGVDKAIAVALRSKVWLKSGGSLVIDPTEALVAIDVNTGRNVGTDSLEETVLATNLEAAKEIVRQVRLRSLSGIIVIDFIDMEEPEHRLQVYEALEREFLKDRVETRLLEVSEFGLVEITRKRERLSLERLLLEGCSYCGGRGRIKKVSTVCLEIRSELLRHSSRGTDDKIILTVHPLVAAELAANEPAILDELQIEFRGLEVHTAPDLHRESYTITEESAE